MTAIWIFLPYILAYQPHFFTWNMACILLAVYTHNIPRWTKFSHELSPNFGHPVEPQMPFGNGRTQGAIMSLSKFDINYCTYRRTSFFRRRRFLRFWTL